MRPNDPGRPPFPEPDEQTGKSPPVARCTTRALASIPGAGTGHRCCGRRSERHCETYSQIGAQFGFAMLWTLVLSYPLMAASQEASGWIARVSGTGLARHIRLLYSPWLSYSAVGIL